MTEWTLGVAHVNAAPGFGLLRKGCSLKAAGTARRPTVIIEQSKAVAHDHTRCPALVAAMSAGVCAVCLGAAPAFTGALGEKPEDRVVAVSLPDVHGNTRHIVICNGCTRTIVAVWARLGRGRTRRLRQKLQPAPDGVVECVECGLLYHSEEDHVCHTDPDHA